MGDPFVVDILLKGDLVEKPDSTIVLVYGCWLESSLVMKMEKICPEIILIKQHNVGLAALAQEPYCWEGIGFNGIFTESPELHV